MDEFLDKEYGLPGTLQSDGVTVDGGDTFAIWATILCLGDTYPWIDKAPLFFKYGQPVRHPSPRHWYGEISRFTRDQLVPGLCAGLYHGNLWMTSELIRAHRKNWFLRAWNTKKNNSSERVSRDWTGPQVWALEARNLKKLRVMHWVFDLENFFGALLLPFSKSRVVRNHMLIALACFEHQPTFVSKKTVELTDWKICLQKWDSHCKDTGEYNTAPLFEAKCKQLGLI